MEVQLGGNPGISDVNCSSHVQCSTLIHVCMPTHDLLIYTYELPSSKDSSRLPCLGDSSSICWKHFSLPVSGVASLWPEWVTDINPNATYQWYTPTRKPKMYSGSQRATRSFLNWQYLDWVSMCPSCNIVGEAALTDSSETLTVGLFQADLKVIFTT